MANTGTQYLPGGGQGQVQQWWGTYLGYIAVNDDPLAQGRVQLRVPQVFGNSTSGWADPIVPISYVPQVGTAVAVTFIGGDPARPAWLGNFAIPGGAASIVISLDAPSNPVIGEIWVNSVSGLMSEWNGAGWVAYQIGTDALQDDSVTLTKLGADVTALLGNGVSVYYGPAVPSSANAGDVWIQTNATTGNVTAILDCTTAYTSDGSITDWSTETPGERSIGGPFVYQQATTPNTANNPTNPPVINDLWINTASGNVLEQMTGGTAASPTWTQFQIGTGAIGSGTGISLPNITGGTITGTTIVADGTSGGEFLAYSGTPAEGNLVASIAATTGTDSYGNAYQSGFVTYGSNGAYATLSLYESNPAAEAQGALILTPAYTNYYSAEAALPPQIYTFTEEGTSGNGDTAYFGMLVTSGALPNTNPRSAIGLWGSSPDGTTSIPHITFYGGSGGGIIADLSYYGYNPQGNSFVDNGTTYYWGTGGGLQAVWPGLGTTESWHNATLLSGWSSVSGANVQYKLMVDNTVWIVGRLLVNAAISTGGTAIMTLGTDSLYWPNVDVPLSGVTNSDAGSPYSTNSPEVLMLTSGEVAYYDAADAGTVINFNCRYPLDYAGGNISG